MIDLAKGAGVKRFVFVSTDKAVNPVSTLGATKLLGEKLVTSSGKAVGGTVFSVVRFGNVLGTRGSVMSIFQNQVRLGNEITVTDPEMTRFFMLPSDAASLVLGAAELANSGEIFILKMKTVRVGALAEMSREFFCSLYNRNSQSIPIKVIGAQPGEKLHEELMTTDEASGAIELDRYYVVNPSLKRLRQRPRVGDSKILSSHRLVPIGDREIIDALTRLYKSSDEPSN
jgi:FlaA1/EpsC-like NDP-sugar epimerase